MACARRASGSFSAAATSTREATCPASYFTWATPGRAATANTPNASPIARNTVIVSPHLPLYSETAPTTPLRPDWRQRIDLQQQAPLRRFRHPASLRHRHAGDPDNPNCIHDKRPDSPLLALDFAV